MDDDELKAKFWHVVGIGVSVGAALGMIVFAFFCGASLFYVLNAKHLAYESCVKYHSVEDCSHLWPPPPLPRD